MTFSMNISRSR